MRIDRSTQQKAQNVTFATNVNVGLPTGVFMEGPFLHMIAMIDHRGKSMDFRPVKGETPTSPGPSIAFSPHPMGSAEFSYCRQRVGSASEAMSRPFDHAKRTFGLSGHL